MAQQEYKITSNIYLHNITSVNSINHMPDALRVAVYCVRDVDAKSLKYCNGPWV